jgi:hypothetical protein
MGRASISGASTQPSHLRRRKRERSDTSKGSDRLYRPLYIASVRNSCGSYARLVPFASWGPGLTSKLRLDRLDLRYFTDQCIANRALWQARYDTLQALAGDPQPIARTPLVEREMVKDLSPEDRYRMLFPLSIPPSLLGDAVPTSENNEPADTSRPGSVYSNSLRQDTSSTITSPMKEEVSSALDKLKSASSDVRTLRAAYRASIKRHPSNSFRHYRSTLGKPASTVQSKLEA